MRTFFLWFWRIAPPLLLALLAVAMYCAPGYWADWIGKISPGCLFSRLTGLECPGCGGTRAFQAFIQGDLAASFRHNPFIYLALPLVAYEYLRTWWVFFRHHDVPQPRRRAYIRFLNICAGSVLLWFLLRNLEPVSHLLSPK